LPDADGSKTRQRGPGGLAALLPGFIGLVVLVVYTRETFLLYKEFFVILIMAVRKREHAVGFSIALFDLATPFGSVSGVPKEKLRAALGFSELLLRVRKSSQR
jgi:hypothetical protein